MPMIRIEEQFSTPRVAVDKLTDKDVLLLGFIVTNEDTDDCESVLLFVTDEPADSDHGCTRNYFELSFYR